MKPMRLAFENSDILLKYKESIAFGSCNLVEDITPYCSFLPKFIIVTLLIPGGRVKLVLGVL